MALNKCLIIVDPECEGHGFVKCCHRLTKSIYLFILKSEGQIANVQSILEGILCRIDSKNYPVYLLTDTYLRQAKNVYIPMFSVRMHSSVSDQESPPHPTPLS